MLKRSDTLGFLVAATLVILPTAAQAQISQRGSVGASASGDGASASSRVHQSARQRVFGDRCHTRAGSPTRIIVQDANVSTGAVGEDITAANRVEQSANQNIAVNSCGATAIPPTQIIRQAADVITIDAP